MKKEKHKINWGILSTAKIARNNIIPAIIASNNGYLAAIASRDGEKAKELANYFDVKTAYSSYEELFLDDDIDAIYNPLPNNLHLEYTLKALKHGKHVLCEKPIGLNKDEAVQLERAMAEYPNLKLMEGFMYKFHPQWLAVTKIVQNGEIGKIKTIHTIFSYNNTDAGNIRNKIDAGGGALMDIGCYCVSFPRFILNQEPERVYGNIKYDSVFKTDFLTSGILNFKDEVVASFSCTTQAFPYQRLQILGDQGRIEIEFPCNAPTDSECKIILSTKEGQKEMFFKANQYQLQCEAFADCILEDTKVPCPIDDAVNNMKVIDAIRESAKQKTIINL